MAKHKPGSEKRAATKARLYTVAVLLLDGTIAKRFARRSPKVMRTLQIRGDQSLERLHLEIFKAFDRYDEHLYEFHFGGKGPHDPDARRYVLPEFAQGDPFENREPAGDVRRTTIEALGLKPNDSFAYWFDFGDDWWHQVSVVEIEDDVPSGTFPRIVQRIGESPPQYVNWDEEEM